MELTVNQSPVLEKTRELCQAIVDQPGFADMIAKTNAFMDDPEAQALYSRVLNLQESLQSRQQSGQSLTEDEIKEFEKERDALISHPVAGAFLDAQQDIQTAQQTVTKYVTRTFELGRVPNEDDFQSCCSGGCSCG